MNDSNIETIKLAITIAALALVIVFVFNVWSGKLCSLGEGLLFNSSFMFK